MDWQEGVLYNDPNAPALVELFDAHGLPAGAILTLERLPGNVYRLSWNPTRTVLRDVRIAEIGEDGTVDYTVLPTVELPCEVDEAVARADKRLEDPEALFAEAVGKKSVFETMCELFDEAEEQRLHHDDLFERLSMIRMVSAATIAMLLQARPCFVLEGGGWWRLDPSLGLKAPRRAVPISSQSGNDGGARPRTPGTGQMPTTVEGLADLAHALDRLADLATALDALSGQRDDDYGLERFWRAFDRLVTAVERRHWRSRPVQVPLAHESGAGRTILDREPLEVALGCLADVQIGTATAATQAQLLALVRELAGSPGDLRTLLAQVDDRARRAELLGPVLDAFEESIAEDRLDDGEALLAVAEQTAGALPHERRRLESAREALMLADLAEASTNPAQQVADLLEVLAANPGSLAIRRRLMLAIERQIEPLATAAADHARDGRWDQAALSLAEAIAALPQHEAVQAESSTLRDELARVGRLLIDDLEAVASTAEPAQGDVNVLMALAAHWNAVTRVSGPLAPRDAGRMRSAYYAAATGYLAAGDSTRATIIFGLLLQQLQQGQPSARQHEIVRDLLERLGGLYDELGLWDESRAIWRKLQTQVPGDQQRRIAGLASHALNACERKPFALRDAWRSYARAIDALSADRLFTLAVSPDHLATIGVRARWCSPG
ncbi:MAG: hypothetical protein IT305_12180 [Chloroflexi bacterium]|nr:hypothetical protein [Chloroflexota bacterium]